MVKNDHGIAWCGHYQFKISWFKGDVHNVGIMSSAEISNSWKSKCSKKDSEWWFFVEPRNFEILAIENFNMKMKVCVRNWGTDNFDIKQW